MEKIKIWYNNLSRKQKIFGFSAILCIILIVIIILVLKKSSSSSSLSCEKVCGNDGGCMVSSTVCTSAPSSVDEISCKKNGHTWCPPTSTPFIQTNYSCSSTNRTCVEDSNGQYASKDECYNANNLCPPPSAVCPSQSVHLCYSLQKPQYINFRVNNNEDTYYINKNCTVGAKTDAVKFTFSKTDDSCDENCEYFISTNGKYLGAYAPGTTKSSQCGDTCPVWIQYIEAGSKGEPPTTYLKYLDNYKWIVTAYMNGYFVIKNKYSDKVLTCVGSNVMVTNSSSDYIYEVMLSSN